MNSYHVFVSPKPDVPVADFEDRVRLFLEDQLAGNSLKAYRILRFSTEGNFKELPTYQVICDYTCEADLKEAFAAMKPDQWKQDPHAEMMRMVSVFRVAFSSDTTEANAVQ